LRRVAAKLAFALRETSDQALDRPGRVQRLQEAPPGNALANIARVMDELVRPRSCFHCSLQARFDPPA